MHRKTPLAHVLHTTLFPNPTSSTPPTFAAHLTRNLVPEVRIETATFYGSLETIEARYPGLNYTYAPHRKRLGRFPHHKRLFEAFDELGLTDAEILGFCRWEGTLWARERYEKDEKVKVVDTTGDEIARWDGTRRKESARERGTGIEVKTDIEVQIDEVSEAESEGEDEDMEMEVDTEDRATQTNDPTTVPPFALPNASSLPPIQSIGYTLNQSLLEAARLREAGVPTPLDAQWEQYFKDLQERGELRQDVDFAIMRRLIRGTWSDVMLTQEGDEC
ncbi:hypothetical protein M011DRAFT_473884 [Sporormia fimetaria CBS 119925]|uniref:Uncharacterized protein n=1 Tax=Sporormia fimetaria CBS 119925 TaxID=1340428 RepID=A0A6A6VLB7_9PLEO|nr:hypothetical protein M011DRAFT_473884 [Sporormia fimetaria CBS 119925]